MTLSEQCFAVVAASLFLASPSPQPATSVSASALAGLWQARHLNNTADVRGTLLIQKDSAGWRAQIASYFVPVKVDRTSLSFRLPDAKGSFVGRLQNGGEVIVGHWSQPPTVDGGSYASPVTLQKDAPDLWRGTIEPLDDPMRFYLVVQPGPAPFPGVRTFLINPERNLGWMWDIDRLELSGDTVELLSSEPSPGRSKVIAAGHYRAEDDVLSFYFSGRGGTYDFERVVPGTTTDFYPRGRETARYAYAPPPPRRDGWQVGTVEQVGISRERIEQFMQFLVDTPMNSVHAPQVHGILVARHGKLVVEEYFHGENRDTPHDTRSASKIITSTLFGAAMQAGFPVTTSTPVYSAMNGGVFPPGLDPLKRSMTVESLLTMSAGLDCDDNDPASPGNQNNMLDIESLKDYYTFALDLKMIRPAGTKAVYCSIEPNLVGGVLAHTTHTNLTALFQDLLAEPLQINRYYLLLQPTGEPYMGGGVRLLPRDFMKFGQLMLNDGTWNGRRIISKQWAERASSPLTYLEDYKSMYGYLWWVFDYPSKGGTVRAYAALGNGGQDVVVIPRLDLVVECFGSNYADRVGRLCQDKYIPDNILPAIEK